MTSEDNDFGSVRSDEDEQQNRVRVENNELQINETSNSIAGRITSQVFDSDSLSSFASKLGDFDYERGRSNTLYKDVDQDNPMDRNDSVVSSNEFSHGGRAGSIVSVTEFSRNDSLVSAIYDSDQFDRKNNSNFQSVSLDEFDRKDDINFMSARDYEGVENPAFRTYDQNTTTGNHIGHLPRPTQIEEGGLMKSNPKTCKFFTYTGMYLLRWNNGKYEVKEGLFIVAYLLWFLCPTIGFIFAYIGYKVWNEQDEDMNNFWQASLIVLCFALVPAIQTYNIRVFNENLPSILQDIYLIDSDKKYKGIIRTGSHINVLKMKFGLLPKSCTFNIHALYKKVPEITFLMAGIAFLGTFIASIVDTTDSYNVFQEWPFLIMMVFYLILPVFSTWFCLVFIDWQKVCYKKIYKEMKPDEGSILQTGLRQAHECLVLAPILSTKNVQILGQYFDRVQDIFSDLSEKVFAYVIGVNVLIFLASSIFCASRMLKSIEFVFYVIPLSASLYHLILLCDRCSNLRKKHSMILAELKHVLQSLEKMNNNRNEREQIHNLRKFRENLHDSPPQVTVYGAFCVDYGMLTTLIGFIISYALIINELFDDNVTCILPPGYNTTQIAF